MNTSYFGYFRNQIFDLLRANPICDIDYSIYDLFDITNRRLIPINPLPLAINAIGRLGSGFKIESTVQPMRPDAQLILDGLRALLLPHAQHAEQAAGARCTAAAAKAISRIERRPEVLHGPEMAAHEGLWRMLGWGEWMGGVVDWQFD